MADIQIKEKIRGVLKHAYFQDPDDLVDVSDGPDDSVHVVIVSRKFDGRRMKEKNDLMVGLVTESPPGGMGQSLPVRGYKSGRDQGHVMAAAG